MYGEPIDPKKASISIFIDEYDSPLATEESGSKCCYPRR